MIVTEEEIPCREWRLGRELDVCKDEDGLVRKATMQIGNRKLGKEGQPHILFISTLSFIFLYFSRCLLMRQSYDKTSKDICVKRGHYFIWTTLLICQQKTLLMYDVTAH